MSPYKPSLLQIISIDYLIGILAGFIIVLPVIYLFSELNPQSAQPGANGFFVQFPAGIVTLGLIRASWRVWTVKQLFQKGHELTGVITDFSHYRFTAITVAYLYHGQRYTVEERVIPIDRTHQLKIGKQVTLLVHPANPQQALMRDLYLSNADFTRTRSA